MILFLPVSVCVFVCYQEAFILLSVYVISFCPPVFSFYAHRSSLEVTTWLNQSLKWYWSSHLILSRKANKQISENVKWLILKHSPGFNHILECGIFMEIRQIWFSYFVLVEASSSVINSLCHLPVWTLQLLTSAISDESDKRCFIAPLHHMTPSSMVLISKMKFLIPLSRVELRWRYALSLYVCLSTRLCK